ncbi:MAG TPA: outer membrane protein assembly factor BamA [Longimicrobiaceae bacterium]|nr:outer membrane protein assembly factor BamA [Longimicrobiaceae bacterium]
MQFNSNIFLRARQLLMLATLGGALAWTDVSEVTAQIPTPAPLPRAGEVTGGVPVDTILVRGNERMDDAVIVVTSGLRARQTVTAVDIQDAIRRLMASGNFENVEVFSSGDPATGVTLAIAVEERPLIAEVEFEGLEHISESTVRDTLGIQPQRPLDPNLVLDAQTMIRDLLANAGIQLAGIDTVLTPVPETEGAFRLTFDVQEGQRLNIAQIEFTGNETFSDEELRAAMETQEEGFFWFKAGKFDRATFQRDLLETLPTFYGEHGYIDFAVASDTMVIDPESGKARITIAVNEGPQYRLGEFEVEGNSRFPTEQLERIFAARKRSVLGLPFGGNDAREEGEVFDRAALTAATETVEQMYRNEGYLFARVEPIIERIPSDTPGEPPVVNVTWAVSESSPFYIDQITIAGNTYTHESVIRDRLVVFPGDIYNEDRLLQSYRSIGALGFFETPLPLPEILTNPEAGEVDLVFHVEEKQTGSINFGTAIGGYRGAGLSGFLGYSQPNLFGQGKRADLRVEYGYGRSSVTAAYTDPSIRGTRNSGSVSIFHTDDRYRGFSFNDGRYIRTGGSLQFGIPVPNLRWTRAFVGYSLSKYQYEARDEEDCVGSIFCQPSALASNLSFSLTRDTKNHPIFPSAGTRQSLTVTQTGGPLGGNGNYQKLTSELEWWVPVGSIGGNQPGSRPIVFAFGLQARGGAIFGDASRFPLERFFLGGTQRGEQLRGYEELSITPLGYFERGVGIPSAQRVGDAFVTLTGEYAVRFNDNLSLSLFAEGGNIWADAQDINPTQLFRSAGLGVTIVTPFGPLGLDYAYGFDRDVPGWKFHFKINPTR